MKIERSKEWWMDRIEKEGDAVVGAGVSNTTEQACEIADRLENLAVALSDGGWEKSRRLVYEAIAALRQTPSDVMPPREPTDGMLEAALTTGTRFGKPAMRNIWQTMYDAALTQEKPDAEPSCEHEWRYTGTDYHGSHKGEDAYYCHKCGETEYQP